MYKILGIIILSFSLSYGFKYEYPFDSSTYTLKEIRTTNFNIIFDEDSKEKAFELVRYVEEEFESMVSHYGVFELKNYIFNQKIRIVVSSDYQLADTAGSNFIFPTIHLYSSVPPEISGSRSYSDPEYLRTIFRHELTYVFTSAIRTYFPKHYLINVLNNAVNPSALFSAPSFSAGAAIARESDGDYGRLKDPYTYHLMRRDLLDNKLPSFAEFGGGNTRFDTLDYPYTYGALFHQHLIDNFGKEEDLAYWKQAGQWRISSWSLKNVTKTPQKDLYKSFKESLETHEEYITHTNALLSKRRKRLNSFQKINDKIYYFNQQNRELRVYNLKKQKDEHILFGGNNWSKVAVSPDEKYLLVSAIADKKVFSIVVHRRSLLPKTRPYMGFNDGTFLSTSTPDNIQIVAINRNTPYPELTIISNKNYYPLYTGNPVEYFNSPLSVDDQYIYFLHSYKGTKKVSRIDIHNKKVSSIDNDKLSIPRFLTGDKEHISVSYAKEGNSFYKRAIIKDDNITFINDNIKGELFESYLYEDILYYKSSFSKQDNLMALPLDQFNTSTEKALFVAHNTPVMEPYTYDGIIDDYNLSADFATMSWLPVITFERFGVRTIMQDSTGAHHIYTSIVIEYQRGTPEFTFSWENEELPIVFTADFYNMYMKKNSALQLGEHHLVSVGMAASYSAESVLLAGDFFISYGIEWQGRFIGDTRKHPYTWDILGTSQVIGTAKMIWQYYVSEGAFGFYRKVEFTVEQKTDYLNPEWHRVEGSMVLSLPILPIVLRAYTTYDTSELSIRGSSVLGDSLIPIYKEFQDENIFSPYVAYGDINLMIFSWEIQNGFGFGELFIERWAFYTGYRIAYWGAENPFLHSVYIKTHLDFTILFKYIPLSFEVEGTYSINTKQWNYFLSLEAIVHI